MRIRTAFAGREAGRFMSFPAVTIPGETSVDDAVERFFVGHRYSAFPVLDGDAVVGLVDVGIVECVPSTQRRSTTAAEIALHDPDLVIDEHQDVAELLERPAFQRVGRAIVLTQGREVGILSITDVERALRAFDLKAAPGAGTRPA